MLCNQGREITNHWLKAVSGLGPIVTERKWCHCAEVQCVSVRKNIQTVVLQKKQTKKYSECNRFSFFSFFFFQKCRQLHSRSFLSRFAAFTFTSENSIKDLASGFWQSVAVICFILCLAGFLLHSNRKPPLEKISILVGSRYLILHGHNEMQLQLQLNKLAGELGWRRRTLPTVTTGCLEKRQTLKKKRRRRNSNVHGSSTLQKIYRV